MNYLTAKTFTDSFARLTGEEQRAVKTTVFDLQFNSELQGLSFHNLESAKDKQFCSVRVNKDIRIIVHKSEGSLLICYVGHHDDAYRWGECRKIETHPKTGAAQLVEIREIVREIPFIRYVEAPESVVTSKKLQPEPKIKLLKDKTDDELLGFGVPPDWVNEVRNADSDDAIQEVCGHLPQEAAEAVLELWTGGVPRAVTVQPASADPFAHPDAQRRFRVMSNREELERALDFPWEKWTVFLHPEQREWKEKNFNGPARVSGSAGTGKTIVALHRAVHLARLNNEARILLTTFSDTLANSLRVKLKSLVAGEPRIEERIEVASLDSVALRLYKSQVGPVNVANSSAVRQLLADSSLAVAGHKFTPQFLFSEWEQIVDAWQLKTWESYRDVARLGRQTRLPEAQRKVLWSIFTPVWTALKAKKIITMAGVYSGLTSALKQSNKPPYDFAVVDESQDINVSQLRFLAAFGANRPNGLFFAGDLGQRIFQLPFSWKSLGVDIRGRARNLRINYRTSHQIRFRADRLLGRDVSDVDENHEDRSDTISVFNGSPPEIYELKTAAEESNSVAKWIAKLSKDGVAPHEFGVFVRSQAQYSRAEAAVIEAGLPLKVLDEKVQTTSGHVSICSMHLAKGLEFRAVIVMACDDDVVPLQERIGSVGDEADLKDIYETERHLLYVACTRARDHLLVTAVEPASEFLDDLRAAK